MKAKIVHMKSLSPTAKEVTLSLPGPLGFLPGAFVNVFLEHDGVRMRRAYSISSDEDKQDTITLSIRKGSVGGMSERFWDADAMQYPIEIMGPLGLNTADKISGSRVFLFGFGIGVSVIRGLLPHLLRREEVTEVTVITGSRTEEESLYKEYFDAVASEDSRCRVITVISRPSKTTYPFRGYVQDHLAGLDFTGVSVYICGSKAAAESLQDAIAMKESQPKEVLVEAFD
jgi:NAD(P)H-flavin reductase